MLFGTSSIQVFHVPKSFKYPSISCTKKHLKYLVLEILEVPKSIYSSIWSTKCLKYFLLLQVFKYLKYQVLEILFGTSSVQVF